VKKLIEVADEGMEGLLGKRVALLCMNYIYHGTLTGVNDTCIQLSDPKIVYETGEWSSKHWQDAQALPCKVLYVQTAAIESFGEMK